MTSLRGVPGSAAACYVNGVLEAVTAAAARPPTPPGAPYAAPRRTAWLRCATGWQDPVRSRWRRTTPAAVRGLTLHGLFAGGGDALGGRGIEHEVGPTRGARPRRSAQGQDRRPGRDHVLRGRATGEPTGDRPHRAGDDGPGRGRGNGHRQTTPSGPVGTPGVNPVELVPTIPRRASGRR